MMASLIHSFSEMMDNLPASELKKAAAAKRCALEAEIASGKEKECGEVASVLTFCRFLTSAQEAGPAIFREFPLEHWTFYADILHKLAKAGELPWNGNTGSDSNTIRTMDSQSV